MSLEIHITCLKRDAEAVQQVALNLHWKFSEIAGDPVLGKDTYCYLTTYGTDVPGTLLRIDTVKTALVEKGVIVVREKIEHIIHDIRYYPVKTTYVRADGG